MKNIIEIAEKFKAHEIDAENVDYAECSEAIKNLWKTTDGRMELAQLVYETIQTRMIRTDISQYIFQYKTYGLTDKPVFKERKKGLRAYWLAPNSFTPKSQNYDSQFTMSFDTLSIAPTCYQDDLSFGKVESFAQLIADAAEAIQDAIDIRTYAVLSQTFNETVQPLQYTAVSTALTETVLQDAIKQVRKSGSAGKISIICRYGVAMTIAGFTGYKELQLSDAAKDELRTRGVIGSYLGCAVIVLEDDSRGQIPDNYVFVVAEKIGYAGTKTTNKVAAETNSKDWSWTIKADYEKGWVILHPEYMALIEIT